MSAETLMCLWIGAFVLAPGVFCQTYVGIIASGNGSIAYDTFPTSINQQGEIAGYWIDRANTFHGFVRTTDGTLTSFDVPGRLLSTIAESINDAGVITGYYQGPGYPGFVAFVRDPQGNFTSFAPPGSTQTIARSINAGGAITGSYYESNRVYHGFVREPNGKITSFDPPGSTSTHAVGINAKGAITGEYQDASGAHGYVRLSGGTIISFDPPGSSGTVAVAINNAGAITGSYQAANGRSFGFVRRSDGTFETFDAPGSGMGRGTFPARINNDGAITGNYYSQNNTEVHAFIRSPEGTVTSLTRPANRLFAPLVSWAPGLRASTATE